MSIIVNILPEKDTGKRKNVSVVFLYLERHKLPRILFSLSFSNQLVALVVSGNELAL